LEISASFGVTLALAFQELATNALKYGALSTDGGSVTLKWAISGNPDNRKLVIEWIEKASFPVEPPTRLGFGSSLIERLLESQYDGAVRWRYPPEGAQCEIIAPLRDVASTQ